MSNSIYLDVRKNEDTSAKKWYIAYTFPKAERRIHSKLESMGYSSYLPLHKVIRNWSDRKKELEVPLFPNYIFIQILPSERFSVLEIKGIVRYVSFDRKPATVSDTLIESLKKILLGEVEVTNESYSEGMPIRIISGPFTGAEGVLLRKNGSKRLVVQIKSLQIGVSVEIPTSQVMQLGDCVQRDTRMNKVALNGNMSKISL
ncbi:UpxY family transcription antiterminator [Flavitalea sp. BT771]|uniref:UpxY family transcription antiterminator n=1 Tax=Flavitalea sp. BT771 TaxID=3063329 RepID=UPI0026E2B3C6|nr:UpxY family transcription antiterminator [Flavitalea sp. BT771]MDO6435738.1 UpxY family transcription antiterminator [Flavitalea sp. BT771]MDV6224639.1 UpxY family transcription antiterminator [Flavitalea sp. BT771]